MTVDQNISTDDPPLTNGVLTDAQWLELTSTARKVCEQDERAVTPFRAKQLRDKCSRHWDIFYKDNGDRFFRDRHWTDREFQELVDDVFKQDDASERLSAQLSSLNLDATAARRRVLLEVGCGAGNFVWPLLEKNPLLSVYACDFSPRAVQLVQQHPSYACGRVKAFVCDITQNALSESMEEPADLLSCIFVMSALSPDRMPQAVSNLYQALRPGGVILFRDYAHGDYAQVRFHQQSDAKCIEPNLYTRQDGTLSYFFSKQFLTETFERAGFEMMNCDYLLRQTTNRKLNVTMNRIFIQAKFRKPQATGDISAMDVDAKSCPQSVEPR